VSYEDDEAPSLDQEPRKVFLNSLIMKLREIEFHLYSPRELPTRSIRLMKGLIFGLDRKSNEKLKPLVDKLQSYERNTNLCTRQSLEQIHNELSMYLHDTYLQEFRRKRLEKKDLDAIEKSDKA